MGLLAKPSTFLRYRRIVKFQKKTSDILHLIIFDPIALH